MLSAKEQKWYKKYEKDLAMPARKYILIYGIIWGVLVFVLNTFTDYLFDRDSFHWDYRLLTSFVCYVFVGGLVFGWIMRKFTIWQYKKLKAKSD